MTNNEKKVEQFQKEVEAVFGNKEQNLNLLNSIDEFHKNGDLKSISILDGTQIGRHQNQYWLKLEVDEPDPLNSFVLSWVVSGKSIAGVKATVLDFAGVCDKNELKRKMIEYIEQL